MPGLRSSFCDLSLTAIKTERGEKLSDMKDYYIQVRAIIM